MLKIAFQGLSFNNQAQAWLKYINQGKTRTSWVSEMPTVENWRVSESCCTTVAGWWQRSLVGGHSSWLIQPSSVGVRGRRSIVLGYESFAKQEKGLRIGQMSDALHGLRLAISLKAVTLRGGLRSSRSKNQKTQSWDKIHEVDGSARHHTRLYCCMHVIFMRLGEDALKCLDDSYSVT
jgi:hypothetical protein